MSLDSALSAAVSNVPECVAGGFVDLSTGMLLGIKTVDSHPQEVLEILAAATADLFQGSNVVSIENLFKRARGVEEARHYFQEIIVNSDNLVHLFLRGKKNQDYVVTFVCRRNVNLGMAITKARQAMPELEASV
ncbi:hypothetical protein [Thiosocius teredinicola]|uniref:hypothetical protein n=1 Tax=Thiosocius teredinicola TaxID=1973002 RepID=UPI000990DA5F